MNISLIFLCKCTKLGSKNSNIQNDILNSISNHCVFVDITNISSFCNIVQCVYMCQSSMCQIYPVSTYMIQVSVCHGAGVCVQERRLGSSSGAQLPVSSHQQTSSRTVTTSQNTSYTRLDNCASIA